MTLSLRSRIVLILVPPLVVLAVLGGVGVVLLYRVGDSIDAILRENYDSVLYMERLNEALERIDSSFQFALAGELDKARRQYEDNWPAYRRSLKQEQDNITLPGEGDLIQHLGAKPFRRARDRLAAQRAIERNGRLVVRQRPHHQAVQAALSEIAAHRLEQQRAVLVAIIVGHPGRIIAAGIKRNGAGFFAQFDDAAALGRLVIIPT